MVQGTVRKGKPCSVLGDAGSAGDADTLDAVGRDNKHVKPLTDRKE